MGAEHLATRSNAALFDITPFAKFDVEGRDALGYLERVFANRIDRPVGIDRVHRRADPDGWDPAATSRSPARTSSCSAW